MSFKLLTPPGGNPKVAKGGAKNFSTYILHLSPSNVAEVGNMCPKSTPGCQAVCLNTAGRGGMFREGGTNTVQEARKRRTRFYVNDRAGFIAALKDDIARAIRQSSRVGKIPCFRLNGTSDLSVEKWGIIDQFPDVQFYDYTKVPYRKVSHLKNYHLTFSQADGNDRDVAWAIRHGMNVATVFRNRFPEEHLGRRVINGDLDDLRFLDPAGVIVGLRAKGKARRDVSGFVIDIPV
jgi:hypothetical protein